jgi:hypothetical protein
MPYSGLAGQEKPLAFMQTGSLLPRTQQLVTRHSL